MQKVGVKQHRNVYGTDITDIISKATGLAMNKKISISWMGGMSKTRERLKDCQYVFSNLKLMTITIIADKECTVPPIQEYP